MAVKSEWPLGTKNDSRLIASKKVGISVLQLQRTEFGQQSVSLEKDPRPQMRLQLQLPP